MIQFVLLTKTFYNCLLQEWMGMEENTKEERYKRLQRLLMKSNMYTEYLLSRYRTVNICSWADFSFDNLWQNYSERSHIDSTHGKLSFWQLFLVLHDNILDIDYVEHVSANHQQRDVIYLNGIDFLFRFEGWRLKERMRRKKEKQH